MITHTRERVSVFLIEIRLNPSTVKDIVLLSLWIAIELQSQFVPALCVQSERNERSQLSYTYIDAGNHDDMYALSEMLEKATDCIFILVRQLPPLPPLLRPRMSLITSYRTGGSHPNSTSVVPQAQQTMTTGVSTEYSNGKPSKVSRFTS